MFTALLARCLRATDRALQKYRLKSKARYTLRVHGPCSRAVGRTRPSFWTPVLTGRWTRPVDTGSVYWA